MNRLIGSLLIFIVLSSFSYAQGTYDFLRLDNSPRAAALAGSFVAANDNPDVIFYNPAGYAKLENKPISFSYTNHLLDINGASLTYSQNVEGIGQFAGGIQYLNYGTFTEADEFGNRGGEFGAGDLAVILGYANQLDENFYYGANVKFIYSGIADVSSSGLAVDLGLQYVIPSSNWVFGFSVLNMGGQISSYYQTKEDLPVDMRIGLSKRLAKVPLRLYLSLNKLSDKYDSFGDRFSQFTFGAELNLSKAIILRLGYDNEKRTELKVGNAGGIAGFSLGLGIVISDYKIDYAYSSMGAIGALHRIGISTAFN